MSREIIQLIVFVNPWSRVSLLGTFRGGGSPVLRTETELLQSPQPEETWLLSFFFAHLPPQCSMLQSDWPSLVSQTKSALRSLPPGPLYTPFPLPGSFTLPTLYSSAFPCTAWMSLRPGSLPWYSWMREGCTPHLFAWIASHVFSIIRLILLCHLGNFSVCLLR